jgi:signal peptidase I
VTASTACVNAASFILEGAFKPLILRTNWSAEARISSSVAGGSKLKSVRMFLHMARDMIARMTCDGRPPGGKGRWMRLLPHLLVPGYPQARNGDRGRALAVGAAVLLVVLFATTTGWLRSAVGLLSFLALAVAIGAWSFVDGRRRRGVRSPASLRPAEWAFLALPLWLFVALLLVPPAREAVLGLAAYRTPSGHESMAPTLLGGDRFVVDLRSRTPERGEIVVFESPKEPVAFVKRVVALPGDVVEADAAGVRVNGTLARAGPAEPFGPVTVPAGRFFALGDNLAGSLDSRSFGPVGIDAIKGRVLYVFWSKAWKRIGTTPR